MWSLRSKAPAAGLIFPWRPDMAKTMTLTIADARALGDRLSARGHSRLFGDQDHLKSDLRLAARVIWHLARDFAAGEIIQVAADD